MNEEDWVEVDLRTVDFRRPPPPIFLSAAVGFL
jgi:hypothetical protein